MWRWRLHPRRNEPEAELTSAVVADACAVVNGHAADPYLASGRPVPPWAWLNALALRPIHELIDLTASLPGDPPRRRGSTVAAVGTIASILTRLEPAEARAIQKSLLVPGHLEVLAGRDPAATTEAVLRAICRQIAKTAGGRPRPSSTRRPTLHGGARSKKEDKTE